MSARVRVCARTSGVRSWEELKSVEELCMEATLRRSKTGDAERLVGSMRRWDEKGKGKRGRRGGTYSYRRS